MCVVSIKYIPWCFLSRIILVVAGPTKSRFAALVTITVINGIKVLTLFFSARNPDSPEGVEEEPSVKGDPGYVSATITGSAVCSEK